MKRYVPFILIFIAQLFLPGISAQERQKAELYIETGHALGIESVTFSPNGKVLASGGRDNQVKIWDVVSGQELKSLTGHTNAVISVTFSPDGKLIASSSGSGNIALKSWIKRNVGAQDNLIENDEATIKLWDARTGKMLNSLSGHSSAIASVAFSPDGKILASGDWEGRIKLWGVRTGKELKTLSAHSELVQSVVFSPDGKSLASAGSDNLIKVWDTTRGTAIATFPAQDGVVNAISFSPDGRALASGGQDLIVIWDMTTRQILKRLTGFPGWVTSVEYSPGGNLLASGTSGGSTILWDLAQEKKLKELKRSSSSISFSPDGQTLASSGHDDNLILLWDITKEQESAALSGHSETVHSVSFSPDGTILASGGNDAKVKLWDFARGKELGTLDSNIREIESVAFSPDGKILASGGDKKVELWDVLTRQKIKTLVAQEEWVRTVAFSPDGKELAVGSSDGTITLWGAATGDKHRTFTGHLSAVLSVVFSPDGKMLASGGRDDTVRLWDVAGGHELTALTDHYDAIHSVAFSPDGKMLASGSYDMRVKLWEIPAGKVLNTLRGKGNISSVAFSPTGKLLASGSWDSTITLWDVARGEEKGSLVGSSGGVTSIAFSPDGSALASGDMDDTVRVWNLKSKSTFKKLEERSATITSIALSPDGKLLAVGIEDTQDTIKLWDLTDSRNFKTLRGADNRVESFSFSPNGETLASKHWGEGTVKLWNIAGGEEVKYSELPDWVRFTEENTFAPYGGKIQITASGSPFEVFEQGSRRSSGDGITAEIYKRKVQIIPDGVQIKIIDSLSKEPILSLISLNENEWIVATSEGRFDTNKSLDSVEGLHWIVNDDLSNPLSLEVFMRQYYEPNLLQRVLAGEQFKRLPSIADINRVQPIVTIKEIKPTADAANSVDVTVKVESVSEGVSVSATSETKKKQFSSGVFDLRLFRAGQLVRGSTPAGNVRRYNEASAGLPYDKETKIWREAHDLKKLTDVEFDVRGKAEFTFHNVRLPKTGEKQVEFSVYAFNADRVKSNTDRVTFDLLDSVSSARKKGRAYLLTIGVNASDNPGYNLQYAANDARKMQEIVGARLKAEVGGQYAEVIQIPLISDARAGEEVNNARKDVIKGVFSLLAGHREEVPKDVLERIEKIVRVPAVEPEDTLIIAFSGHGYADRNGIFYMLPADMPKDVTALTTETLKRTISSDELSLWMRDITANEMLMIVDACHSAAAVQGRDFKPGPMGSRGLGQLAYDKGMRILAATQSDNVALELDKLQQGLLSYALVKEGIEDGKADTEAEFRRLTAAEWLGFAVKAVPRLYDDILAGRLAVVIDGKKTVLGQKGPDVLLDLSGNRQRASAVNLQQPSLFDFRRKRGDPLFNLPEGKGP